MSKDYLIEKLKEAYTSFANGKGALIDVLVYEDLLREQYGVQDFSEFMED